MMPLMKHVLLILKPPQYFCPVTTWSWDRSKMRMKLKLLYILSQYFALKVELQINRSISSCEYHWAEKRDYSKLHLSVLFGSHSSSGWR